MKSKEELKNQLAEAGFSNAIPEMVKAAQDIGLISKQMNLVEATSQFYKLQEQGKVISEEILPAFGKRLREVASSSLQQKLNSNAVAMQRLVNVALPMAGNEIFKAGFGDGLTDLFNQLSSSINDLIPLGRGVGRILGSIFHGIARGVQLVTPPLRLFGDMLDSITELTGKWSAVWNTAFIGGLTLLATKIPLVNKFAIAMKGAFATMLLPIMKIVLALGLMEELLNRYVYQDKVGLLYDPRKDPSNSAYDVNSAIEAQRKSRLGSSPAIEALLKNGGTPSLIRDPIEWLKGLGQSLKNLYKVDVGVAVDGNGNIRPFVERVVDEKIEYQYHAAYSGMQGTD